MTTCTVVLDPPIPEEIIPHAACGRHLDINVGAGLAPTGHGKSQKIVIGAQFCLRCGRVKPVDFEYRHWFDALGDFWAEFGWHSKIGRRLQQFAGAGTRTEYEAFMALKGYSPEDLRRGAQL
jgi:hypothetical protein